MCAYLNLPESQKKSSQAAEFIKNLREDSDETDTDGTGTEDGESD